MDVLSYLYGIVIFIGGLIGYFKAGSIMSLVSSTVIFSLVMFGAYLSGQTPRNVNVLLSVCIFVSVFMGFRFYKTSKFFPAGFVALLSILQVIRLLASTIKLKASQ
ncbi:transmembrane protein 14A-like [Dysidea avara]|uniref:transmembrane protein 14A-like n=1 Tax=Dysidea avara TaxID=196820 RepID=UPI003317DCFC